MKNVMDIPTRVRWSRQLWLHPFTLILVCCISGFAYQQNKGPIAYPKKIAAINRIVVLPLNFDCYHLTAGGIREYDDDISRAARQALSEEVKNQIGKTHFTVEILPEEKNAYAPVRRYRQFYSVVNSSISNYFTGTGAFPKARKHFRFTLPPADRSILPSSSDGLLIINGFDDLSTKKRDNAKVGAAVASVFGIASAALIGVGGVMTIPPDISYATCALINRKGQIIWYNTAVMTGDRDLTSSRDASMLMWKLLKELGRDRSGSR